MLSNSVLLFNFYISMYRIVYKMDILKTWKFQILQKQLMEKI